MNQFIRDLFETKPGKKIVAVFRSGRECEYTTNIYNLLITDPDIVTIYDYETGEILFTK